MAERASLAKRDWLSMRDELWRIEDFLNKWSKGTEGQLSKDPVAIILAKEIDSYRYESRVLDQTQQLPCVVLQSQLGDARVHSCSCKSQAYNAAC